MSWTVKVDAPTVFMPDRLRTILATKEDDQTGVYFQNCKEVLEGFFGNLEVVSAEGFKRFLEQIDTSYTSGCWRQDTEECKKGWKYGTWGEDLFMQRTMDDAEVSKISDLSLTSSGTCPGDRPKDKKKDTKFVPTCTPVRPKLPSIHSATSNHGSNALAPLPARRTVRSWSERRLHFFCTETIGSGKVPC